MGPNGPPYVYMCSHYLTYFLLSTAGSPAGSPAGRAVASLPSSSKLALTSSSFASIIEPYPEKPRTFKGDKPAAPGLGDDVRDKCIELVYDALAGDSNVCKWVSIIASVDPG